MSILVTGGAGFVGSNFVLDWLANNDEPIINLDKLTYAGNLENLQCLRRDARHIYFHGDIADMALTSRLLAQYRPRAIINLAVECQPNQAIFNAEDFIQTNVVGVFRLLESARMYWSRLPPAAKDSFRFLQISTDEVYGSSGQWGSPSPETKGYSPDTPYAASKATSDHLAQAYFRTYQLPVLMVNSSNNYGPYHFPDKLIPRCILNALADKPLPLYGDGLQVRDWLYVKDHCSAICRVLERGQPGQAYNVSAGNEKTNIEVVNTLCKVLDQLRPRADRQTHRSQIAFLNDPSNPRRRYALNGAKIRNELGWQPAETFATGLVKTVQWYIDNQPLVANVRCGAHQDWLNTQYAV